MQRNQWPLHYKASAVCQAALAQEQRLLDQAAKFRQTASDGPTEYCSACGRPTGDRETRNPEYEAERAETSAKEYARWAEALTTRGDEVLPLHLDDAKYFGLLEEDHA